MAAKEKNMPLVADIKRNSLEDGPGIRSVVFFKGCLLSCIFCHNPETQDPGVEIVFSSKDCIRCARCKGACPKNAIALEMPGRINRDRCDRCGECVSACPGRGLRAIGSYYEPEALAEILLQDTPFYRHSGGGVTISGGESTLYPEYLESLFRLLKGNNVHIALETSGYFEYEIFRQKLLPYLDLIYYDIKFADTELHRRYTGKSNHKILENFRRLVQEREIGVYPRVPLVPGITATRENLSSIIDFLYGVGADSVYLLPYNPMGIEMNLRLGRTRPYLPERFMRPDEEEEVYAMFKSIVAERGVQETVL